MGTPSDTPTPESGGLVISTGITSTVVVQNVVVVNTAPTQGAFAFFPGRAAEVTIRNNVAVNNTGVGFHLGKSFVGDDPSEYPNYAFENNISVFNEKHDPFGNIGGSGILLESETNVSITGSIFRHERRLRGGQRQAAPRTSSWSATWSSAMPSPTTSSST